MHPEFSSVFVRVASFDALRARARSGSIELGIPPDRMHSFCVITPPVQYSCCRMRPVASPVVPRVRCWSADPERSDAPTRGHRTASELAMSDVVPHSRIFTIKSPSARATPLSSRPRRAQCGRQTRRSTAITRGPSVGLQDVLHPGQALARTLRGDCPRSRSIRYKSLRRIQVEDEATRVPVQPP
jgi:hypothetical protein